MHARSETTVAGIATAIEKGRSLQMQNEREWAAYGEALSRQFADIQWLETQLASTDYQARHVD